MHADDIQRVATEAAEQAAHKVMVEMFMVLGIDHSNPIDAQADFRFLREWRETTEAVRRKSILTATVLIISGALGLLWLALKSH